MLLEEEVLHLYEWCMRLVLVYVSREHVFTRCKINIIVRALDLFPDQYCQQ